MSPEQGLFLFSLYLHPKFKELFDDRAEKATDGLYPTITIRQIIRDI